MVLVRALGRAFSTKTVTMNNPATCPQTVDSSNRIIVDFPTAPDTWSISQNGKDITATRTDSTNPWGLDLEFYCCGKIDV